MYFDRKKIVKDLISNRGLWLSILTNDMEEDKPHLVTVRELEKTPGFNVFYVGLKENKKADFKKLAEKWNILSVQFFPNVNSTADELIAELWVE